MRKPNLEEYIEALEACLPVFTHQDQRTALAIYRKLSRGHPVTDGQLGAALDVPGREARRLRTTPAVDSLVYENSDGEILGFGGLAAAPMHHRFEVDGIPLWTWCAWDSLFIPELLGKTAQVTSSSPSTDAEIRLRVSPSGVESVVPASTVVSFLQPGNEFAGGAENIMAAFCHFIYFFESETIGWEWVAGHPGTFLYSLSEAEELSRRINRRNFGGVLAQD